ncbi:hypothetical protein EPN96_00510 [bacterium]|nr:MAG: hypothetical protein EPN96_00510 [bacterium]
MKSCAFSNIEEFYRPQMSGFDERTSAKWSFECSALSPLALFWGFADGTVFLPEEADEAFLSYIKERLGLGALRVIVPRPGSHGLSRSILNDSAAFEALLRLAGEGAALLPWGESEGYRELLGELAKETWRDGLNNHGELWKVRYLGSKSGFRHFFSQRGARLPEGRIAGNVRLAAGLAGEFLDRGEGVVLKADWGVGGKCQLIVPSSGKKRSLAPLSRCIPELKAGAVIVERFIESAGHPASVSCQGEADGRGGFSIHYLSAHLEKSLSGEGALIGKGAFESPALEGQARKLGFFAGKCVSAFGYAGVCGFDMAVDGEGVPWLLEMNPRRTTTTHGAALGELLLGDGWEKTHCVAVAMDAVCGDTFAEVKKALAELLFPAGGNREGVVITAPPKGGKGSFAALARDAGNARKYLAAVRERFRWGG